MEIKLKWVHMARYGLILRLDGALWLTIIFKPLLTPKGAIKKKVLKSVPNQPRFYVCICITLDVPQVLQAFKPFFHVIMQGLASAGYVNICLASKVLHPGPTPGE